MQLTFDGLKKAKLGFVPENRWDANKASKAVFGGVSWPGKRPGFAVVVAMDKHRRFESYDVCLLAEYESSSVRQLVRQSGGVLDYQYEPIQWVGDWKNDAADKFIREMNAERTKQETKFSPILTPILEMEWPYPFMLDELKRLLAEKRRALFLKDSAIINYLSEIAFEDIADLKLGDYPAIEALCFAVFSMKDSIYAKQTKPKPPMMQDRSYSLGARR
jgi:hypothetical protein